MQSMPEHIAASVGLSPELLLLGAVSSVFIFVFIMLVGAGQYFIRRDEIRKRALAAPRGNLQPSAAFSFLAAGAEDQVPAPAIANLPDASEIVALAESGFESGRPTIANELVRAGFFKENAVYWFYTSRFVLALAMPACFYLFIELAQIDASSTVLAAMGGASLIIGLMLPNIYIARRQQAIRQECRYGFPDFMDLMVVCAEAGLSPRASLDQVSRELIRSFPYLGTNLYLSSLELRAGRALVDAIQNLERRVRIEEIKSLGSLLQQTEELGSSQTAALRVYSEEMREKRLTRAEEKAHGLPVKLLIPLALYIFPVMLIVIMLPLVIRIKNALL